MSIPILTVMFGWGWLGYLAYLDREFNNDVWVVKNKYKDWLFKSLYGPLLWIYLISCGIIWLIIQVDNKFDKSTIGIKFNNSIKSIQNWFEKE